VAPASPRASQVDRLIADLQSSDPVRRDAAVARLRVLGTRSLPRLSAFIRSDGPAAARALALSALEGVDDTRAMTIALSALESTDVDAVVAGLAVLRGWVAKEAGTRVLEAVTALAVDRARDGRIRFAASEALSDLPEHLVRPIKEQAPPPASVGPPLDDPAAGREWVQAHGRGATLSTLHDAIKAFREREESVRSGRRRDEWLLARSIAHQALAERGSRLALYDLRETLGAARSPLPPGFLVAVVKVGDASCLEPLARAWSAAARGTAWRNQLSEAAREIVRRLKLGARSAVLKEIRATWPGLV
jgi:hypothetical protein